MVPVGAKDNVFARQFGIASLNKPHNVRGVEFLDLAVEIEPCCHAKINWLEIAALRGTAKLIEILTSELEDSFGGLIGHPSFDRNKRRFVIPRTGDLIAPTPIRGPHNIPAITGRF